MERDQAEKLIALMERIAVALDVCAEAATIHIVPVVGDVEIDNISNLWADWRKEWKNEHKLIIANAEPLTITYPIYPTDELTRIAIALEALAEKSEFMGGEQVISEIGLMGDGSEVGALDAIRETSRRISRSFGVKDAEGKS